MANSGYSSKRRMYYSVKQIIPATNWYGEYRDGENTWYDPIVCFALVEYEDMDSEVIPLFADEKIVTEEADNMTGLVMRLNNG